MCEVLEYYTNKGIERGIIQGISGDIMDFLNDLGPVPKDMEERILREENPNILKHWLKLSARVSSTEEFREKMENVASDLTAVAP